ncbi:MAG: MFS transporter [Synergistaceae bacterium]|nr:MFS transporter [Synergistaceae bacterium]
MRNKLFYTCFYAFFYGGIIMITLGCSLPDIRAAYNLSDTLSGALLSSYSFGNLTAGVIMGLAGLYFGQKKSIIIAVSLIIIGLFLLITSHVKILLFLACALIGLGRGSSITFSQRGVSILSGGNPRIIGLLHAFFAVGAILAPLIFSLLRVITWQAGIIFVIIIALIELILFASIKDYSALETLKDSDSDSDSENNKSRKSIEFMKDSGFVILCCSMFLYLCCEQSISGWLVTYMNYKSMTMNFSQSMAALLWLVMLIGRLSCVWLAKYISNKKIFLISSISAAIFFAFMLKSEGEIFIALSVICLGLCMAGISPIIYASSAPYTNKYPLALGMLFTIGCTGGTIMPFITGFLADIYGFDGGMSAIFFAFALLILFAIINLKHER